MEPNNQEDHEQTNPEEIMTVTEPVVEGSIPTVSEDPTGGASEFQFEKEPFFLEDQFRVDPEGGLEYIDTKTISRQRGVLPALIKSLGSAIVQGKPVNAVAIPMVVCAENTTLERMAGTLTYAPQILEKGGESDDPLDQFCYAIAHWVASFHLASSQLNPVEGIIGETYQGKIAGLPVYFEQVTTAEAGNVMAYYLPGNKFTLSATWGVTATMYPNSIKGQLIGPSVTTFKNTGAKVFFQHPPATVSGLGLGKRKVDYGGKFYAWDYENKLFAELEVNPPKDSFFGKKTTQTDYIRGTIWTAKDSFLEKVKESVAKKRTIDLKYKEKEAFDEEKAKIEGSWIGSFKVGDKIYWKFGAIKPHKLMPGDNLLSSDSTLRPDIILRRQNKYDDADKARETLKIQEVDDTKKKKKTTSKGGLLSFLSK